jgi:DnaK suppressor protein
MPATSHTINSRTGALEHHRTDAIDDFRRLLLASRDEQATILYELNAASSTDALDEHAAVSAAFARNLLEELEGALARIDSGIYGTCELCGGPIGFERLRALPHSRTCIACASLLA